MTESMASMQLTVRVANPEIFGRLTELYRQFPKEVMTAQLRAASIISRKIAASVADLGTKETGVLPPLSILRRMLWPNRPAGGVLTRNAKALCRVQRSGSTLFAGYVSGVSGVFSRWQDGGVSPILKPQRQHMRRMLVYGGHRGFPVPDWAVQPKRPVVEPIYALGTKLYPEWVLSAALKIIDRKLVKAGF